jgi:beta-lactamase regulating signal transducer with metallopeptidase domain
MPFTITFSSKIILPTIRNVLIFPIGNTIPIYKCLFYIWILGIIVKSYIFFKKYIFTYKLRYCPIYLRADVSKIVDGICKKYKRKKKFKILYHPTIKVPAIIGIIKPKIIMPETEFSQKELYFILSHEITHYYKKDLHMKFLYELLCIVYWWNPIIFLAKDMIATIMEIDTDCKVTENFSDSDRVGYAELLIKVAKSQHPKPSNIVLSYVNNERSPLYQRVNCILEVNWSKKNFTRLIVFIFSIVMVIISFSVIVEPYYEYVKDGESNINEINQENSYLIEKDGYFELYQNDTYIGDVTTLEEPFNDYKIYKKKGD